MSSVLDVVGVRCYDGGMKIIKDIQKFIDSYDHADRKNVRAAEKLMRRVLVQVGEYDVFFSDEEFGVMDAAVQDLYKRISRVEDHGDLPALWSEWNMVSARRVPVSAW